MVTEQHENREENKHLFKRETALLFFFLQTLEPHDFYQTEGGEVEMSARYLNSEPLRENNQRAAAGSET